VAPLEEYPHYAPLAWQVRMLVHLYRGEEKKAAAARRKRDAASIGRVDVDGHLDASILYETAAWSMLGDLLALKRSLTTLGERARRLPCWAPYYHIYKGSYHTLRGEREKALEEHRRAFALVPKPGMHGAWSYGVNHLAATLVDLDRAAEAEALVTQAISDVEGIPIAPYESAQLEMNLALAEASLGKGREATRHARHAMDVMVASGTGGVVLVEHHAKQALVALNAQDRTTFRTAASTIETMCSRAESAAFAAKHEYLLRQARSTTHFQAVSAQRAELVTKRESHTTAALGLRTELERCDDAAGRARRVLTILLDWSGTDTGYLYLHTRTRLAFVASSSGSEPPESLERSVETWVRSFLASDVATHTASRVQSDSDEATEFDTIGLVAYRDDGPVLAGVVALGRSETSRSVPESILDTLGEGLIAAGDAVGLRSGA
jgi:tetratricopeptide (TPR) repeat protein